MRCSLPPLYRRLCRTGRRSRSATASEGEVGGGGRTEYQRGILFLDANGEQTSEANCMVVLHDEQGNVAAGDLVDVIPLGRRD